MIERGIESPHWMAKHLIAHAPANLVKYAVIQLLDWFENDVPEHFTAYEIADRLVQVSATGRYEPPVCTCDTEETVVAEFGLNPDGTISEDLTPEQQRAVDEFLGLLDDLPDSDDPHEDDDDE